MSWLLIAATPTLLMLGTVGLERIESGLSRVDRRGAAARTPGNPQVRATAPLDHV